MLFLVALVGAAVVAWVLWKAMNTVHAESSEQPVRRPVGSRPRVSGPDDDPDFLRRLDERVRRREDPPAG